VSKLNHGHLDNVAGIFQNLLGYFYKENSLKEEEDLCEQSNKTN